MNRPQIDFLYRGGRFLAKVFLPTFGSMVVEGRENLPKSGPLLIASNHQSYTDPAVLIYAIDRPMWWMAKRSRFPRQLMIPRFWTRSKTAGLNLHGKNVGSRIR